VNQTLQGIKIVNIGYNLPAPLAASKLAKLGANVIKVEPIGGDPFKKFCPDWYQELVTGQQIINLDLKTTEGIDILQTQLKNCDIFLTSSRMSSLSRMGLHWEHLHIIYPNLCMASIVGSPPPNEDIPGHDLTYQAQANLVYPPNLPKSLFADIFGAELVVQAILGLVIRRNIYKESGFEMVSLSSALDDLKMPIHYRLTIPGGMLGGGNPRYNLYQTSDGWVAIAALEEKLWQNLVNALNLEGAEITKFTLQNIFSQKTAHDWKIWALQRDIPLVEIK
jgi:alpha-methylacyl-CoA racemase